MFVYVSDIHEEEHCKIVRFLRTKLMKTTGKTPEVRSDKKNWLDLISAPISVNQHQSASININQFEPNLVALRKEYTIHRQKRSKLYTVINAHSEIVVL